MNERAHEAGLRPVRYLLTSAKKAPEMTTLLENRKNIVRGREMCYIVGVTSVREIDIDQSRSSKIRRASKK